MKKIIVPIDFSVASKNALNYALQIAPIFNLGIEVVHVYSGLFNADETFLIRAGMGREESLMLEIDNLIDSNEEAGTTATLPNVKIERHLLQGMPDIALTNRSQMEDAAMIIMGTTGSHGIAGKLFGSVSTHVARNAKCPVLLIPINTKFKGIHRILFASDYESADPKLIKESLDFASAFESSIYFVHVVEDDKNPNDFDEARGTIFDTIFADRDPSVAFEITNIYAHSVSEGLHNYIEKKNINLAVMVSPKRNFFQNIFHKSKTREMAFNTKVPILVLN